MSDRIPRTALPGSSQSMQDRLARGLGWFSLALGAAELAIPGLIARAAGIGDREILVRAYGVRELATGIAILRSDDATPWVWARVAGDALDVATAAATADNPISSRTLATLAVLAGAGALDAYCAIGLSAEKGGRRTAIADYRDRSGFPHGIERARGAARRAQPALAPVPRLIAIKDV